MNTVQSVNRPHSQSTPTEARSEPSAAPRSRWAVQGLFVIMGFLLGVQGAGLLFFSNEPTLIKLAGIPALGLAFAAVSSGIFFRGFQSRASVVPVTTAVLIFSSFASLTVHEFAQGAPGLIDMAFFAFLGLALLLELRKAGGRLEPEISGLTRGIGCLTVGRLSGRGPRFAVQRRDFTMDELHENEQDFFDDRSRGELVVSDRTPTGFPWGRESWRGDGLGK